MYNICMKYKSNHNVVYSCKYHVVWCPKYRRKVLLNGVDTRLKELIQKICEEYRIDIIEIEIMPNRVHLLMEADPQFGVHKAISYFVSTAGGAPLAVRKQYIESQKNV